MKFFAHLGIARESLPGGRTQEHRHSTDSRAAIKKRPTRLSTPCFRQVESKKVETAWIPCFLFFLMEV